MRKMLITLGLFLGFMAFSGVAQEQFPERWVLSKYVKEGRVDTGNPAAVLNVRSGPGSNFDTLGSLKYGQPVVEYASEGEWIRISPTVEKPAVVEARMKEEEKMEKKLPPKTVMMIRYGIILTGLVATLVVLFIQASKP